MIFRKNRALWLLLVIVLLIVMLPTSAALASDTDPPEEEDDEPDTGAPGDPGGTQPQGGSPSGPPDN